MGKKVSFFNPARCPCPLRSLLSEIAFAFTRLLCVGLIARSSAPLVCLVLQLRLAAIRVNFLAPYADSIPPFQAFMADAAARHDRESCKVCRPVSRSFGWSPCRNRTCILQSVLDSSDWGRYAKLRFYKEGSHLTLSFNQRLFD